MRFLKAMAVTTGIMAVVIALLASLLAAALGLPLGMLGALGFALYGVVISILSAVVGGTVFACLRRVLANLDVRAISAVTSGVIVGIAAWLMLHGGGETVGDDGWAAVENTVSAVVACVVGGLTGLVAAIFGYGLGQRPSIGHEMDAFGDDGEY
jgi:hypothetical protein